MADIKISALNQAPQNWNLNDFIPFVDSGATQTYRQSLEYLFGNWSGQTITSSNQYFIAGNGTDVNKITINGSNRTVILASESAEAQGTVDGFIAASREDGSGHALLQSTEGCAMIATRGYQSVQNAQYSGQFASRDSNIYGGETVFVLGSSISDVIGSTYRGGMIACTGSGSLNNSNQAVVMASEGSSVNLAGGSDGVNIGSYNSNNYPTTATKVSGLYSSYSSTLSPSNYVNTIIGSWNTRLNDATGAGTKVGNIIGGYNSRIEATNTALSSNQAIFNAYNSSIVGDVLYTNTIVGSDNSQIDGGSNNHIIGCEGPTISGLNNAMLLGVHDATRDAIYDNTVHTDNIHTFLTETFNVVNAGSVSGSIDVDCSTGTIFLFELIGNTTPNFTNVRDGQRFIFVVYNNGSWTVPTATVNSVAGTVFAKNSSINPSNNQYTKYTATYVAAANSGNGALFLDEELAFGSV